MHFSLTALQEPGALETRMANLAKHSVIRCGPAATEFRRGHLTQRASVEAGGTHYGLDCDICHGADALRPNAIWTVDVPTCRRSHQ